MVKKLLNCWVPFREWPVFIEVHQEFSGKISELDIKIEKCNDIKNSKFEAVKREALLLKEYMQKEEIKIGPKFEGLKNKKLEIEKKFKSKLVDIKTEFQDKKKEANITYHKTIKR